MLQLSKVAGTKTEIKSKITALTDEENCKKFYKSYLNNMITKRDIDLLKAWRFNSIRLPIEKEPVAGQNTLLKTGFELTDKLLS